jgi:hypothetical protein
MAEVFARARREHEQWLQQEAKRRALHGEGTPILSAVVNGVRAVAVGNRITSIPDGVAFHEFLHRFLEAELTSGWGMAEMQKPEGERHQLIRWRDIHFKAVQRAPGASETQGFWVPIIGASLAWFRLAYDLYLIQHNAELEAEILDRIRYGDFQAARYELAVAAAFSNAQFDIAYADKRDRTKKRAELVATHRVTGHRFAVEAKAKQRHGVFGYVSPDGERAVEGAGLRRLFTQAMKKDTDGLPLLVFIDANLPSVDDPAQSSWVGEARSMAERYDRAAARQHDLNCAALFVTNDSCAHDLEGTPHPIHNFWGMGVQCANAKHPLPDRNYLPTLNQAMAQRARIPHDFPTPPGPINLDA